MSGRQTTNKQANRKRGKGGGNQLSSYPYLFSFDIDIPHRPTETGTGSAEVQLQGSLDRLDLALIPNGGTKHWNEIPGDCE